MNLVKIENAQKLIFVGDTHGDLEASQKVINDFLKPGNKIIFLGDYVDRGLFSKENLDFLLTIKEKYPEQIILLQGNHEGYRILQFFPAEFWQSLNKTDFKKYASLVEQFPLVAITDKIVALHGALPEVNNLEEINQIKIGDQNWQAITWGDFVERPGERLGVNPFTGRPQFGRDYFLKLMKRFNKKVLIRSHQPDAPQVMFDNRCLTIFTSSAYAMVRTIAIVDLSKKIETVQDIKVIKI